MGEIGPALFVRVRPEDFPPHKPPWCATASEKLELRKTLFWENVKAIHRDPTSMGFLVTLCQNRRVQGLVCKFNHHTACGAP